MNNDNRTEDPCDPLGEIPLDVRCICIAYESGFGDGIDGRHKVNPYKASTKDWYAWGYGVRCGMAKGVKAYSTELQDEVGHLKRENAELIAERDSLLRRLDRHIRWCSTALDFLKQVVAAGASAAAAWASAWDADGNACENEWPELAEFIERSESKMIESAALSGGEGKV